MSDTPDVDVVEPSIASDEGNRMNTPKLELEDKESIVAGMFAVQNGVTSCRRSDSASMEEHAKVRDAWYRVENNNPNPSPSSTSGSLSLDS